MKEHGARVGLVKIPVSDMAAASAWYRETLGLDEEFAVVEYGWAQYRTGSIPVCLYVPGMGGGDGTPGGETGVHLSVDNAAAALAAYRGRGGETDGDLVESDDGGKFFLAVDPDGNRIKVIQI